MQLNARGRDSPHMSVPPLSHRRSSPRDVGGIEIGDGARRWSWTRSGAEEFVVPTRAGGNPRGKRREMPPYEPGGFESTGQRGNGATRMGMPLVLAQRWATRHGAHGRAGVIVESTHLVVVLLPASNFHLIFGRRYQDGDDEGGGRGRIAA